MLSNSVVYYYVVLMGIEYIKANGFVLYRIKLVLSCIETVVTTDEVTLSDTGDGTSENLNKNCALGRSLVPRPSCDLGNLTWRYKAAYSSIKSLWRNLQTWIFSEESESVVGQKENMFFAC